MKGIMNKKNITFAVLNARVAELVDASVSKTDGVVPVPVRSRLRVQKWEVSFKGPFFISNTSTNG